MSTLPPNLPPAWLTSQWASSLRVVGRGGMFLLRTLARIRLSPLQCGELLRQIYIAGVRSLIIILTSALFVGMVLGLQAYDTLSGFGASESAGSVVALSLFRELGPVLSALLFVGRAGTSITAEIGLMRATEQIDALEIMAIDSIERIVLPRLLAALLALPVLTLLFDLVGLLGGYLFTVTWMGIDQGVFWSDIQSSVTLTSDFLSGLVKSFVFGLTIGLIATYFGYESEPTSQGVSQATTNTVITSSILVLIFDFVLSALMF